MNFVLELKPHEEDCLFIVGHSGLIHNHAEYISKTLAIFEPLEGLQDDRAVVLVCAMIVENYLDQYIESFIPRYNLLKNENAFFFSWKIQLARSLCLCPNHIFNSIDLIREIRNEFAHNLNIKTLKELDKSDIDSLLDHAKKFTDGPEYEIQKKMRLYKSLFISLATNIAVDLDGYGLLISELNEHIRADGIYNILNQQIDSQ